EENAQENAEEEAKNDALEVSEVVQEDSEAQIETPTRVEEVKPEEEAKISIPEIPSTQEEVYSEATEGDEERSGDAANFGRARSETIEDVSSSIPVQAAAVGRARSETIVEIAIP